MFSSRECDFELTFYILNTKQKDSVLRLWYCVLRFWWIVRLYCEIWILLHPYYKFWTAIVGTVTLYLRCEGSWHKRKGLQLFVTESLLNIFTRGLSHHHRPLEERRTHPQTSVSLRTGQRVFLLPDFSFIHLLFWGTDLNLWVAIYLPLRKKGERPMAQNGRHDSIVSCITKCEWQYFYYYDCLMN